MSDEKVDWLNLVLGFNLAPSAASPPAGASAPAQAASQTDAPGAAADAILRKLKSKKPPSEEIAALDRADMRALLATLGQLRKAGVFEDLASSCGASFPDRFGVAFLTVDENYGEKWQELLAKLDDEDRALILARVPRSSWPSPKESKKNAGWQGQQSAALQYAVHYTIDRGKLRSNGPHDWTMSVAFAGNYAAHEPNKSGPEVQALVQFSYDETTGQSSLVGGAQGALVQALWNGMLQVQEFVQAVAGVAASGKSRSGTVQAQIGVQLLLTVGPVQIGVQVSGGGSLTQDSVPDLPGAASVVIQGNF